MGGPGDAGRPKSGWRAVAPEIRVTLKANLGFHAKMATFLDSAELFTQQAPQAARVARNRGGACSFIMVPRPAWRFLRLDIAKFSSPRAAQATNIT